jgi:hypothetical protein
VTRLLSRAQINAPTRMPDGSVSGRTPLLSAVDHCGLPQIQPAALARVIRAMVTLGADPEAADTDGMSVLTRAKYACPPEVLAALTE